MTASPSISCPRCGAAASGNFCAACGAALGAQHCGSCGTVLSTGARFCQKCGSPVGHSVPSADRTGSSAVISSERVPLPSGDRTPWVVAGFLVLVTVAAVAYFANKRAEPSIPSMANAGNAAPGTADAGGTPVPTVRAPDLSNMTPKEQYTRLVARIARADAAGDSATVINFTPMALGAYTNLPPGDRDIDARYHAAMLEARVGMLDNARALADTIMKASADNLLGYHVRAAVAGFGGDSTAAKAARAAFRAHYDAELKKDRPEYALNRSVLEAYRKSAGPTQ